MSWAALVVLAAGSYGLKVAGLFALRGPLERRLRPVTALLPAALFAALVVVQTLGEDGAIVVDARVPGVLAGAAAAAVRAPFVAVVVIAMVATAAVRATVGG